MPLSPVLAVALTPLAYSPSFIPETSVQLIGVEPAGKGIETGSTEHH